MTTKKKYTKPLPTILPETKEYWKATTRGELLLQKCNSCGQLIYFPRIMCYKCLSEDLGWTKSTGYGIHYIYTIIHRAAHKSFEQELPYVYAIVELDDGPRMITNIVNIEPNKVRIGMRVKVVFEEATPEISIPKFEAM